MGILEDLFGGGRQDDDLDRQMREEEARRRRQADIEFQRGQDLQRQAEERQRNS